MTKKSAVKKSTTAGKTKLALKKETLADLSVKDATAGQVRGQSTRLAGGGTNHNESLVRDASA